MEKIYIEDEISQIIEAIYDDPELDNDADIEFTPKEVDEKAIIYI
ncbi:hypothetical protein ACOBV8_21460 (plasmid) [Pseudoalteromonas espejiana]